jgi:hypothetical protein
MDKNLEANVGEQLEAASKYADIVVEFVVV